MVSRFLFVALLATALPVVTTASEPPSKQAWWLAASGPLVTVDGRNWGRLSLEDGELCFFANGYEWRIAVADIARIETVGTHRDTVTIDTTSGATYFVVILDANLTPDSPRRFLQEIDRSVKDSRKGATATLAVKGSR
jgi:hypothetical protein